MREHQNRCEHEIAKMELSIIKYCDLRALFISPVETLLLGNLNLPQIVVAS